MLSYVYNMFTNKKMAEEVAVQTKKKIVDYLPIWMKNIHSMFYYYLLLVGLGIIFFCTSLFINYFTTPFTGDYSSQQFAFYTNGYDDWWHFFTTGQFVLYDTNTYLGVDNIGSNSFYYLFDPFFLPILLVPRQLVPQGMAILTIFKIALSGMTFFVYMRYLGASRKASKITGIAYAFSGWMTWYLWFNHFTGVTVVFPLILYGIEKVLREKKPWILAGAICIMGFVNFFFCICFVMCAFLYAMFRYFQRLKLNNWKDNLFILGMGFCGFFVGLLMPMAVVFPSAMHALTSPRASGANYLVYLKEAFKTSNLKEIFKLLTSWTATGSSDRDKARNLYPFIEFIFPVTSCRGTPLTVYGNETYDNVAGSFYCFLPMLLLLPAALKDSFKQKHFSVIAPIVFFIFALFTPMFYYLFHGFTQAYSRWTLFVVTSILAYVGLYLDKFEEKGYDTIEIMMGWGFLIVMCVFAGIAAATIVKKYDSFTERVPVWLAVVIECAYITLLVGMLILIKNKKKVHFYTVFTAFLTLEITLMGIFVIQGHGVEDYYYTNKGFIKNDALHKLVQKTTKNDKTYYRSYSSLASSVASNDEMRNNYNGMNFFHSVYNYNTADINNWSAISNGTAPGSWSGTYVQKRPNLDTLLGIKYYYIEDDYYQYQNRKEGTSDDFRYNAPLEYLDITENYSGDKFRVYKNMNYIDFALTYDTVYETKGNPNELESYEGLYTTSYERKLNLLGIEEDYLKAAIINQTNDESIIPDIKDNHQDINVLPAEAKQAKDIYTQMKIERYSPTKSASKDAMQTYYDIYSGRDKLGKDTNSLTLSLNDYLTLLNTDNDTFVKHSAINDQIMEYRKYVSVIEANNEYFGKDSFYDPTGNIFFMTASFMDMYEVDIYFVDVNNEVVTYDNHNDGYYDNSRAGKEFRTFYIAPTYKVDSNGQLTIVKDAPKIKKIIMAYRSTKANYSTEVYVETATKYFERYNKLKENPVTDVVSKTNKWTFKTNFDTERVVVTRLAYEEGFTLKMKDSNRKVTKVKTFNGQGGFVSFVAGKGAQSYTLTFETPYLRVSCLISGIGGFLFFSSLIAYLYIDKRLKKNRQADDSL